MTKIPSDDKLSDGQANDQPDETGSAEWTDRDWTSKLKELPELLDECCDANYRLVNLYRKFAYEETNETVRQFLLRLANKVLRDEKELEATLSGNVRCPLCNSPDQNRIVYDSEDSRRGKYVTYGGCKPSDDPPRWHCLRCNHKWKYEIEDIYK
ncbi:MAG: hypothetical protein GWO41_13800 [candidate division Zixibacteria bacterium]|nr:hypothetical protein [candidate division Zixibacteria bacterium]NIR63355.1 hypothetical protein [candidate division Zixibacteria bacterium]NIS17452.1 hypothetical protein [candidate division Zixibacteria bacterium]NIS45350.1 hypothetical protein [candidate division Zixibacteria bacterium]NIT53769.1 hypothetical protein [candidate division Zixibacteria bacterium]